MGGGLLSKIPKDRMLTETDGPYVRVCGRPAEPRDVQCVLTHLARLWSMTEEEVESQVYVNFRLSSGGVI